jgi:hypothetical protein
MVYVEDQGSDPLLSMTYILLSSVKVALAPAESAYSPVVDGWTRKIAEHIGFRWRRVIIWVGCEDHVPLSSNIMKLGCPQISRIVRSGRRVEKELELGIVPVAGDYQRPLEVAIMGPMLTSSFDFGRV